jgi:TPR repeat protein
LASDSKEIELQNAALSLEISDDENVSGVTDSSLPNGHYLDSPDAPIPQFHQRILISPTHVSTKMDDDFARAYLLKQAESNQALTNRLAKMQVMREKTALNIMRFEASCFLLNDKKNPAFKDNVVIALRLLKTAANEEHKQSLFLLGLCYFEGIGINTDKKRARELFHRSAKKEFIPALKLLIPMYQFGDDDLTPNPQLAQEYHHKLVNKRLRLKELVNERFELEKLANKGQPPKLAATQQQESSMAKLRAMYQNGQVPVLANLKVVYKVRENKAMSDVLPQLTAQKNALANGKNLMKQVDKSVPSELTQAQLQNKPAQSQEKLTQSPIKPANSSNEFLVQFHGFGSENTQQILVKLEGHGNVWKPELTLAKDSISRSTS